MRREGSLGVEKGRRVSERSTQEISRAAVMRERGKLGQDVHDMRRWAAGRLPLAADASTEESDLGQCGEGTFAVYVASAFPSDPPTGALVCRLS